MYSWRSKTDLPIAKVMFCKVINKDIAKSHTDIEVSYETFPISIAELRDVSIDNILYLFKETVIGFEKLFSVFGSFLISNKMIVLNKNNRCKVWIN